MRLIGEPSFNKYNVILAEQLDWFFPRGSYQDILLLESDIAEISELVLLFSESFGSACELGVFSTIDEVARRLVVFIDDLNAADGSFVSLGPLRSLRNLTIDQSVCVLDREELGFKEIEDVSSIKLDIFSQRVSSAIKQRNPIALKHSTLDIRRPGHVIKLAVGFIQHYSVLTLDELCERLSFFVSDLDSNRIQNLLLCAEFVNWVSCRSAGMKTYYVSTAAKSAMVFEFEANSMRIDRLRWRFDIVEHWRATDPERMNALRASGGFRQ